MTTIRVDASRKYDVLIGDGLLDRAGGYIRDAAGGHIAAIVTDDVVAGIYPERMNEALRGAGYETVIYKIKSGEASKNAYTYIRILDFLAENRLTRSDVVVAFGGGVVGDLAGFAAATYMRGIHYAQIPTTLIAAVDSSIGGKTGIDLDMGKNIAGVFYQPSVVICDCDLIDSLPPRIFTDGCAEVIKYAMIADHGLFRMLDDIPRPDLEAIITRCVSIKRDIVNEDEFESGARKLLNFGHTIGHAVEKLSGYKVSHGKAVAIGMAIETSIALNMRLCGLDCYRDLIALLHVYGLPYQTRFGAAELAQAALSDKKRRGDRITLVFPKRIGKCTMRDIAVGDLEGVFSLGLDNAAAL